MSSLVRRNEASAEACQLITTLAGVFFRMYTLFNLRNKTGDDTAMPDAIPPPTGSTSSYGVIDCDVHPYVKQGIESVYPYMPAAWKQRFIRKRVSLATESRPLKYLHPNGTVNREDARPPCGGVAASDPHYLVEDLLQKNQIESAVLNSLQTGSLCSALATTDESIVLASAFNDFFLHEWLPVDARLKFAMTVPSRDPMASAAEIRRIGKHGQIVAVALPPLNILLGNRYWWPIYEAAQDMQLPILIHVTGPDSIYQGAPMSAGGLPDSYAERYVTLIQVGESSINSLVFSGTLEKFPHLKFLFVEYGFSWLLPLLWRMHRTWRQLRHEVPWVRKSPIDYVHAQCRFTTQPLDEPDDPRQLDRLIELMGYDQLCFSTDYPHWDNEMPGTTLRSLPPAERRKVFRENAANALRMR
jgi:predicted TIM-barrel fold metal-dependent hydrolase